MGKRQRRDQAPRGKSLAIVGIMFVLAACTSTPKQSGGPINPANVVAELRGTELPEEYGLLGAHLDSWDLGTGALDNGCDAALVIEVQATGAKFKLVPWDGDIFMATLMATDQFGPIVDLDYMTRGFAQFQMDKDGKLNLLRLSLVDGQAYEFRRE